MRHLTWCVLLVVPCLLVVTTAPGCSKEEKKKIAKKDGGNGKKPDGGPKTPLEAGDAVIKGVVVYNGDPPVPEEIAKMKAHENAKGCLAGPESEKVAQTWLVDKKTKGVANVVIWLQPPAGKYFAVKEEDKKRSDPVVIDQPHCAFVPHVVALYPSYFDGKALVKTGQKLKINNSAPFQHNTTWTGDGVDIKSKNFTIPPKGFELVPFDYEAVPNPLEIKCNFHTWMNGWILFFDNPYHAVTKADGSFEIKNVPVGTDLTVVGWHEGTSPKEFYKEEKSFKKGDNTLDLKVKQK